MDGTFHPEARERLRAAELQALGPRYSPWFHWLAPLFVGGAVAAGALATVDRVAGWEWAVIPATLVLANAAEWRIHRDLLHRPSRLAPWLYERHTLMHHRVYVEWDMEIRSRREWGLVLIPPAAVLWVVAAMVPPALAIGWLGQPDAARVFLASAIAYVLSYEALHLTYHLPVDSPIGQLRLVRWLRRHHAAHHHPARMGTTNFNVSVPLWDRVRGTTAAAGSEPGPPAPDPGRRGLRSG